MTARDAAPVVMRRPAKSKDAAFVDDLVLADALTMLHAVPTDLHRGVAQMQVTARRASYAAAHPLAIDYVLSHQGQSIGRLLLDDSTPAIVIVDFRIVAASRKQGLGTAALTELCSAADQELRTITLSVDPANPATRLYERMGFSPEPNQPHDVSGSLTLVRR